MTRERLTELWPVMDHFKNGGDIDVAHPENMIWDACPEPRWSDGCLYRIRPTPKLVPLEAEDWLNGGLWWQRRSASDPEGRWQPCSKETRE